MVSLPNLFKYQPMSFTDCHISNIITCDILTNKYSEHAKTAIVRPILKKMIGQKLKLPASKSFKYVL